MSNQKNEQGFRDIVTNEEFKVLHDALKYVNIPFSTKYNALYDLKDASLVLLHMCKTGLTANKAVADLSVMLKDDKNICIPTAQWLLGMISAIDSDKMDALCRRILNNTVKNGLGLEKKTGYILAIDKHLILFTGTDRHNDSLVVSGKPKGGTSRFETYATMQAVTEERLPTIAVVHVTEHVTKVEFVRKLLSEAVKQGFKKPVLFMDREFANVEMMRFLNERGERFLMAVSKTPGIKNAAAEFRCGKRKAVSKYEMRSSNGTVFRFNLVIKKRLKETKDGRKWKYLTYATNLERQYIKTNHQRYSRGIQKAMAYREQLQISRADACPHRQPKSFDQSLYVLSFYDRMQSVVYGSAKNEQCDRDQTETACQNKYYS